MGNVWIDSEILDAIGGALRHQHSTNKKYYPHEMANAIANAEGVGTIEDYFGHEITQNTDSITGYTQLLKKVPKISLANNQTSLTYAFAGFQGERANIIPDNQITNFSHLFSDCLSLKTVLPFDTSSGTNFSYMFYNCQKLIRIPKLDVSNGTSFRYMFYHCALLEKIPDLDVSNGTYFSSMFESCASLTTVPQLNTSNGTSFDSTFKYCRDLITISQLDTSNGINFSRMFEWCPSLENLGGFLNLGQAYLTTASANYSDYTLSLSDSNNLTHQSLMNVINNLYDIASKGCKTQKLNIGNVNLAKLTSEEIVIATNKGWSIS